MRSGPEGNGGGSDSMIERAPPPPPPPLRRSQPFSARRQASHQNVLKALVMRIASKDLMLAVLT